MKRLSAVMLVFFFAILFFSGNAFAADMPVPRFIPGSYVQYQRNLMTEEELQAVKKGGREYIAQLIKELQQPVPEYPEWLRRGVINMNPNNTAAKMLHRLADNYIPFTKEEIDGIIVGLDHPDPGVVWKIRTALTQTFGIWFVEGEDWIYKSEDIRLPHKAAWKKFWKQNRDRHGQNLPLIINDLSLDACFVELDSQQCLRITIANHGGTDWKIYTEVSGKLEREKQTEHNGWEYTYTLFINGREEHPILPAAYNQSCRERSNAEMSNLPDRPAHIERVLIPAGKSYAYTMNISQSFPRLSQEKINSGFVVRYAYGMYGTHKGEPLWRGELRSVPLATIVK